MNRILSVIFRPSKALTAIANEEPVFSSLLIFTLSVLAGNILWVRDFFISWQAAIFNSLSLVFLWGGVIVLIDLILTGILALINPSSSGILNMERFRKLIIVQLNISIILIFRPVINIFAGSTLSWIVVFIWGVVLMLFTVASLWDVAEIKAAFSMGMAVIVVFIGIKALRPSGGYLYTKDFSTLKDVIKENLPMEQISLLGIKDAVYNEENLKSAVKAVDEFMEFKQDFRIIPYCVLIKARALLLMDKDKDAKVLFRQLVARKDIPLNIFNTAMLSLYQLVSAREFALLPRDNSARQWRAILNLWRIPVKMSNYKGNVDSIGRIKIIIKNDDIDEVEKHISIIIDNFTGSDFEDDIYFWIAERYEKEGDFTKALKFYGYCADSAGAYDAQRIKIESAIRYAEERMGIDVFQERFRAPYAMIRKARIYKSLDKKEDAGDVYLKLIEKYPSHTLSAKALFELAQYSEETGEFSEAVKLYNRMLNNYPFSSLLTQVQHKKNIIKANLNNNALLAAYSSGWKKWQDGKYNEAIEIYKKLIDDFPSTEVAQELQYNIGEYYRKKKEYMQAIHEFRTGYKRFKDSPRGLDFGWQLGNVLADDLRYYNNAVSWYTDMMKDYEPGYKSRITGITTADLVWKSATICKKHLKDYKKAKQIYAGVIDSYSDPDLIARALFETALIDEKLHQYLQAVPGYNTIISRYSNTRWKEKAKQRIKDMHKRGLKLLEKHH